MEKEKEIQVPAFIGEAHGRRPHKRAGVLAMLVAKAATLAAMATVATVLILQGEALGYVIYGKEVIEFCLVAWMCRNG